MKNSLYQTLLSRLKNKHSKLASRFHKSVKDGEFQRQKFRKRRDAVERLKSLEKRISILGNEVGVKPKLSFKHWAVALALGVVVSAGAQEKQKDNFKARLSNYTNQASANNQLLAQSVFFEPKVGLGSAYLSNFHSGDLDGDGDVDAIYVSYLDSPVILTNEGSFTFTASNLTPEPLQVVDQTILADFDGDGDLDLFMVNGEYGALTAQMWVNDGSGNFTSQAATFPLSNSDDDDNAHIVDVDGDGDLDIITESSDYPSTVTVLTNNAFTFSIDSQLSGPNAGSPSARPLAVLDVDDDGDIDIVYRANDDSYNDALHVFENTDGLGSFVDTGYALVLSHSFDTLPDTLDIDNDGDTDLIGGMSYSYPIIRPFINDGTVLNDGTNNFTEGTQINLPPGQNIEDVFTANFNNDGTDEFMVITEDGTADSVFLYQENTGAFNLLAKLTGQAKPADLDGDGDDDLFHFEGNVTTQENQGGGSFAEGADMVTVHSTYDVQLVDIDGDGDLDLAEGGGQISRSWLNDGSGNFSILQEFPGEAYQLTFGDLDGDGDQDMVVALESDGGEYPGMIIYTNAGGTLSYHSNIAAGYEADQVELADMDQDGDLDIVARLDGISNNYVRIFDNTGSLAFSETSSYLNEYGQRMALGDIDGDSDPDIVLANEVYGIQTIINNNGLLEAGTLASPAGGGEYYIADVDLSDLDGDGDLDVFASNAAESPTANSYVFFNGGTGTFTDSSQNVETGSTYNSFLGDIDGDGDDDLVVGGYISYPELWVNDGAGNFTFDHDIPTIVTEYGKAVFGDLDGDGNQDMVIGDYYGGIKLFFNTGAANLLEADASALTTIFDNMDGANWTDATNWGTADVSTWFGIELNTDGDRVARLELPNNGLTGTLPAAINQLDALEILDLSDNDIDALGTNFSALTSATDINLNGNQLDFGDLESVASVAVLSYTNQQPIMAINETGPIEIPVGSSQTLTTTVNGTANTYQWVYEGSNISGATDPNYSVDNIDRTNMGAYQIEVSNSIATGVTLTSDPVEVLATAIITANVTDADDNLISENVDGYILEIKEGQVQFDTLHFATQLDVSSAIEFPPVVLGDFLISVSSDPELYVPTYYSNSFLWDEADTLKLNGDETIQITITEVPPERTADTGDGVVSGTIEEDFGEEGSRIDARRRAAKRKCGLRKRRRGGRIGQEDDEFELIAYGETNDQGEFEYGFLPEGTYRFFVEYPGIPLDESAFVEFEVGPAGVGDNDFKLAVFASEDGISIEVILGASSPYFKHFEIYPNPTFDKININYDQAREEQLSVQVLDLNGKVLMNETMKQSNKQLNIDLSELGAGQYLIRIFDASDRNAILYKVIKK